MKFGSGRPGSIAPFPAKEAFICPETLEDYNLLKVESNFNVQLQILITC